jgi:hypothetical protein
MTMPKFKLPVTLACALGIAALVPMGEIAGSPSRIDCSKSVLCECWPHADWYCITGACFEYNSCDPNSTGCLIRE